MWAHLSVRTRAVCIRLKYGRRLDKNFVALLFTISAFVACVPALAVAYILLAGANPGGEHNQGTGSNGNAIAVEMIN